MQISHYRAGSPLYYITFGISFKISKINSFFICCPVCGRMSYLCTSQCDTSGILTAKYYCQKPLSRANIPCQNPGGQKTYFLPSLSKSSQFTLGGGRKCHQKSPPRGRISGQMPKGRSLPPRGITLTV